jgi:hypothetical protein
LRLVFLVVLAAASVVISCRDAEHASPVAASPTVTASSVQSVLWSAISSASVMSNARIGPAAVSFPPNNEPYDFRLRLETFYQTTLRASISQTYVNLEGGGVWISEYIRYRVFQCSHNYAVSSVMTQIDTLRRTIPATCGEPPTGAVEFPPRNEPADFRRQLEVKYRDGLRAGPTQSYVDLEGDIVWMQQYFLYRLNGCDHDQASSKTLVNIQTQQVQAFCGPPIPPPPQQPQITVYLDGPSGFVNSNRDVSYSGLRSTSTAGRIVSYAWNCGAPNVANCNSTSPTPTFNYPKVGRLGTSVVYVVTLTVTDSAGNRGSTSVNQQVTQVY